ncbi:SDR family NAD(P)-dependent oxidoreductase [Actinokineospora globicatena]|uniref:SDR family NAD(P)-dependent oxidoreductase n=1 Tax=Actinokineospora globicatena TaxID=103729 RepID=UPI0020A3062F|nr:SDR family NAD(P)-dependent oxidoreductase [Actinokineospora globicatena]MCP2302087.1 NADP-dependent 3-hydroxy acid dehydrogenase YdfG [Actinokineospora globicatena]GLW76251.1 putative short chain dehydrogenase/reductase [Actinokineospora globicatena]GLW83087.1 putative short chain dehydrogenase/reductase [Actinokineospora globicatena]
MRSFAGKVAVVTGAASGIGAALVAALVAEGAQVAASDVNEVEPSAGVRAYRLDVADRDAVYAHATQVVADFGRVDLVVNNAGVALMGTVAQMSDDDLRWVMDIDFWGVVHGTRAFLPHLVATRGHLVNVSSVFGLIGVPTQSAYNAAKFAVRGFTESLRQEVSGVVGVTCVHPGGIKTAIARTARTSDPADRESFSRSLDRVAITSPERAARVILDGVRRDRARVLVGPDAYLIDLLPRLLGSWYQPLVRRVFSPSSAARRGSRG